MYCLYICYSATTHSDLLVRAVDRSIPYRVIHNASIMNAVGCCGLQLYHFGETVSIPFWTETWKPNSFVEKIDSNLRNGLHTLCLLGRQKGEVGRDGCGHSRNRVFNGSIGCLFAVLGVLEVLKQSEKFQQLYRNESEDFV